MQRRARALADPTRLGVYRAILRAGRPVGVSELAGSCGVHPNTVRLHLAKLKEAGLVLEELEVRHTRGRPGYRYQPAPEQGGSGPGPSGYEHLALMLAEVVRTGRTPREVGRAVGRRHERSSLDARPPIELLVDALADEGFEPLVEGSGERVEVVLRACPFVAVAEVDAHTVCQLHVGLAEGLAESAGDIEVEGVSLRAPRTAGCRVRVRASPIVRR